MNPDALCVEATRQLAKILDDAPITADGWVPAGLADDGTLSIMLRSPTGRDVAFHGAIDWIIVD
jgi:hypothetical protein